VQKVEEAKAKQSRAFAVWCCCFFNARNVTIKLRQ